MMLSELEQILRETFTDFRLSGDEKSALKALVSTSGSEEVRFLRNRAFEIFREHINQQPTQADIFQASLWLERVVKALDSTVQSWPQPRAFFSPGEECLHAVINFCDQAHHRLDLCVFTVADNRLAHAVINAFHRGVAVRVISDDEKSLDKGSDIARFIELGIDVRMDSSRAHMHHKFAIADEASLLNGSFNWTRSASERNQENILVTYDPRAIEPYCAIFESLWQQFK